MVGISGHGKIRRLIDKTIKRDIQNWRDVGNKFETTDKSYYLKVGEKVWVNSRTKEVKIK